MPTYHDLCVEMGKRGPYLTDPVGKCLRNISAFAGDGRSRIDKYLRESATYAASLAGVDLKKAFDSKRAIEGVLEWIESRKDQSKVKFPILVDEEAGVVKQPRKEYYGLLEDVEDCLYRETLDGTLIPWHESKSNPDQDWASHTDEAINAADSTMSTTGTNPSSSSRRVGQGHWRKRVMLLWGAKCLITGCTHPRLLRGSHIKRWRDATTAERLDERNGLMLAAHVDAAFEVGLISFASDGKMLVSKNFTETDRKALAIPESAKLPPLSEETQRYLAWHRQDHGFD